MNQFILLLHYTGEAEAAFNALPKDEFKAAIAKYKAFAAELAADNRLIAAEGLQDTGKVIRKTQGSITITDGPYILAKEMVGGFYLFTANSLEEAIEIAQQCPALETGGTVELRPI
ncbi:MAG: YciI family protein [Fimbriimonadaceae bacterium]